MIFLQTYFLKTSYMSQEVITKMIDNNLQLFNIFDIYKNNLEVPSQLIDKRKIYANIFS